MSTIFTDGAQLDNFIPFYTKTNLNPILLPPVDIQATLKADLDNDISIPRFGIKIQTAITKEDGFVEEFGDLLFWKIAIQAPNAISLNFEFINLTLPEGSAMFIYNTSETMFHGPVEAKHLSDGKYSSDVIRGNECVIFVFMPTSAYEQFSINISNVIHGFREIEIDEREFNSSKNCSVDVNCSTVSGSVDPDNRDAVGLILVGGFSVCSGSLINNNCKDFRPYFLTAAHCHSSGNQITSDWVIRFNYDSPNPTPPNCRGAEPKSWISYSGATLRALSGGTDFALVELNTPITNQPTLALSGWNRSNAIAVSASTSCIHHPGGDVKKVNFDLQGPTIEGDCMESGTKFWETDWETGVVEQGSSGSPLLDANGNIIGQLKCVDNFDCSTQKSRFGRLSVSWDGGGSPPNRLKDWLGVPWPDIAPTSINSTRIPFISGPGVVCTSIQVFNLENIPGFTTVEWTVSPSSLIATPTTGTTHMVPVAGKSGVSGIATITFTITRAVGCNPVTVSRNFWVGLPTFGISAPSATCTNSIGTGFINYQNGSGGAAFQGVSSVSWNVSGAITGFWGNNSQVNFSTGGQPGSGFISAGATNVCGIGTSSTFFQVISCGNGYGLISLGLAPNPTSEELTITLLSESDRKALQEGQPFGLNIYNQLGETIAKLRLIGNTQRIDVSQFEKGLYFVEVSGVSGKGFQRFILLR